MTPRYSDEDLAEARRLVDQHGTIAEASRATGKNPQWFSRRLRRAAALGRDNYAAQAVPPGFRIMGHSTYYDKEKQPKGQWIKTVAETDRADLVIAAAREAFESARGGAGQTPPPPPTPSAADTLGLLFFPDLHLGLKSWGAETGAPYDLEIAAAMFRGAVSRALAGMPPAAVCALVSLGDFFHADSHEARTPKSHHALDVDTRHAKVLLEGVRLVIWAAREALRLHGRVIVRILPGNHDPESSVALAIGLAMFFEGEPRVEVDLDPGLFWAFEWGVYMLVGTHGHTLKGANAMAHAMSGLWPQMWGRTRVRLGFRGHIHHETANEIGGARVKSLQAMTARDAFHAGGGFASGRSLTAWSFNRHGGAQTQEILLPDARESPACLT